MVKSQKVVISERALLARINRKLRGDERRVKKCRENSPGFSYLGEFYVVDFTTNSVVDHQVDLAQYAGELDVLAPFEVLEV